MTRASALIMTGLLLGGCSATSLHDGDVDSGPDALPDTVADPTDTTPADVEPDSESPKPPLDCSVVEGGPRMVAVSAPGGTTYCIDATEVTQVQYALFLQNTSGAPGSEHPECGWNDSYEPFIGNDTTAGRCVPPEGMGAGYYYDPATTPDRPVMCIDWCDAVAFCHWAGKRLCGRVGGGDLEFDDHANPALSQWYNACSNGGTTAYCYGDQYDVSACPWPADADPGHVDALDVGSAAGCRGSIEPYTDIRDMSGSIFEWTAACGSSKGQRVCAIAGGVNQDPQMVRCDFLGTMAPSNSGAGLGIRCCKD